ncbi:hypothetical protein KM043_009580 [Ampulex compressa]|nr:hypothetical protein KM043_009580 [Ampulex compressa]
MAHKGFVDYPRTQFPRWDQGRISWGGPDLDERPASFYCRSLSPRGRYRNYHKGAVSPCRDPNLDAERRGWTDRDPPWKKTNDLEATSCPSRRLLSTIALRPSLTDGYTPIRRAYHLVPCDNVRNCVSADRSARWSAWRKTEEKASRGKGPAGGPRIPRVEKECASRSPLSLRAATVTSEVTHGRKCAMRRQLTDPPARC